MPKATQQEMEDARLDLGYRDHCAHLLIPLNECRQKTAYMPWQCQDLRHAYEKCQYDEYVGLLAIAASLFPARSPSFPPLIALFPAPSPSPRRTRSRPVDRPLSRSPSFPPDAFLLSKCASSNPGTCYASSSSRQNARSSGPDNDNEV